MNPRGPGRVCHGPFCLANPHSFALLFLRKPACHGGLIPGGRVWRVFPAGRRYSLAIGVSPSQPIALAGDLDDLALASRRSRIAVAAGTSPMSLPQSSSGRLLVIIVECDSCRRMMISTGTPRTAWATA